MIVGYHVIFGAYGFWLPNDPRGSWSDFVGSWNLFRYGPANKTRGTRSVANLEHDQSKRLAAKRALKYPPVEFAGVQARTIGIAFAAYFRESATPVWACAILPSHVHLVIGKPEIATEQVVIQLKGEATQHLLTANLHPFGNIVEENGRPPKCFARGEWKVFLDADDVVQAIHYVEQNPVKEGKKSQH